MFESLITKFCAIPVSLVLSVIHVESSGRPEALSKGNYGLMQVRFATAKEIGCGVERPEDLFLPHLNIRCGCTYLEMQMRRYKRRKASLVAYNQGSVFRDGKIVMNYKGLDKIALEGVEQNVYATKILNHRQKICAQYSDCGLN